MFRKIVSYLICWGLILQPLPLYAMEITVLQKENAWDGQIEDRDIRCLTVKKAKSGQVRLAFDKSLEIEGTNFLLVLDKNPVGRVFYKKGQLNFWGYAGNSFSLESPATYVHPLFCAQAAGDLCLLGGQFSKESVFISENLTTSGKYTGVGSLLFQVRQGLSFQGDYTISQLAIQAKKLNLNATGSANVIQVHAESIDEAATNKFFAEKQMVFSGYTQGFTHRGTLKSKNHIVFKDGVYTGCSGSQTLAGCLLQNKSKSINESGRLVAGLGHFQSPSIAFKDPLNFSGYYFHAEGTGNLTTDPQSRIQVQYGAKLGTTGKLNQQGSIIILKDETAFPYQEFFGLGVFSIPGGTPTEQKVAHIQKTGEIRALQKTFLPNVDLQGISLEGVQGLVVKDAAFLYTPTDNIELRSAKKLLSKGTVQSGFFEGLKTIMKAESIILEGVMKGNALLILVDHYLKINGVIENKLTQVVFTKREVEERKKAEAQTKADTLKQQQAEALKKQQQAEAQKKAETLKKQQQAEVQKKVEEQKKQQAETLKKAEEQKKLQAEAQKKTEEQKKQQVETLKKAEEQKKQQQAETLKKADEQKKLQAEAQKKTEEQKKQQVEALKKAEEQKKQQAEALKKAEELKKQQEPKTFVLGPNTQFNQLEVYNAELTKLTGGKGQSLSIDSKHLIQDPGSNVKIDKDFFFSGQTADFGGTNQAKNIIVKATEKIDINKTATLKAVPSGTEGGQVSLDTKNLNIAGKIEGSDFQAQARTGTTAATAKIDVQNSSNIKIDDLDHAGRIKALVSQIESTTVKTTPTSSIVGSVVNSINTSNGKIGGNIEGGLIDITAKTLETKDTSKMKGTQEVKIFTEEKLKSGGQTLAPSIAMISQEGLETTPTSSMKGEDVILKAPTQKHAGNIEADRTALLAQKMALLPSSTIKGNTLVHIEAPQEFNNEGELHSQHIYADIYDASKIGKNHCECLVMKAQVHPNPNDIISGKCPDLTNNDSFSLITPNPISITMAANVSCSLDFTSPSITLNTVFNSEKDLTLSATQELDIKEDLSAKGNVSIQAPSIHVPEGRHWVAQGDMALKSPGAVVNNGLVEGANVNVQGRTVLNESVVKRHKIPGGYEDRIESQAIMRALRGNLNAEATDLLAARGAKFEAMCNVHSKSAGILYLGAQQLSSEYSKSGKRSKYHRHTLNNHKTQVNAGENADIESGKGMVLEGLDLSAGGYIHAKAKGTLQNKNVHDIFQEESHRKSKGGMFRKKKKKDTQTTKDTAIRNTFKNKGAVLCESEKDNIQQAPHIESCGPTTIVSNQGKVLIKADTSSEMYSTQKSSKSIVWQSQQQKGRYDETVEMLEILAGGDTHIWGAQGIEAEIKGVKGKTQTQAIDLLQEQAKTAWVKELRKDPKVTWHLITEEHKKWNKKAQGLTGPAAAVISLAIVIATQGVGATLIAPLTTSATLGAMSSAAFTSLVSQASISLINNQGNIDKVLKDMGSKENLRSLATSIASAGATQGIVEQLNLSSRATTFTDHLQKNLVNSGTSAAFSMLIHKQDVDEAFLQAVKGVAAGTMGGLIANSIGAAYGDGELDWATHKLAHGALGAFTGVILGDDPGAGALAGALGGMAAEIIADSMREGATEKTMDRALERAVAEGRALSYDDVQSALSEEVNKVANIGRMGAALSAFVLDQDVNIAHSTATNAVDNNFVPLVLVGLSVASALYSCYEVHVAYEEGGVEGALIELAKQGVINAAGGAVGKLAFKIGGKVLPATEATFQAILAKNPMLAMVFHKASSQLEKVVDTVANSKVGQAVAKIEAAGEKLVGKTREKLVGKTREKVEQTVGSGPKAANQNTTPLDPVSTFELKHNKKAVQNMTDHELAQSLANRAERKIPGDKGPEVGKLKHKYGQKLFERYQESTGQHPNLVAEGRFKANEKWEPDMGLKDSVVPDLYNIKTKEAFDYKFGGAQVTQNQRMRYEAQLPRNTDGMPSTLTQIKPNLGK